MRNTRKAARKSSYHVAMGKRGRQTPQDTFTDEALTRSIGSTTDVAPVMMYPRVAIDDIAAHELERGLRNGARRGFILGSLCVVLAWVLWSIIGPMVLS